MNSRDTWQAMEVRGVQRQDMSHGVAEHHCCEASIMCAPTADLRSFHDGEPAFERNRPFVENSELTAQLGDRGRHFGWRPAESVDIGGAGRDDPELHQHLRRQNKTVAARKQAT